MAHELADSLDITEVHHIVEYVKSAVGLMLTNNYSMAKPPFMDDDIVKMILRGLGHGYKFSISGVMDSYDTFRLTFQSISYDEHFIRTTNNTFHMQILFDGEKCEVIEYEK